MSILNDIFHKIFPASHLPQNCGNVPTGLKD